MTEPTTTFRPLVALLWGTLFLGVLATIPMGSFEPAHFNPETGATEVHASIGDLALRVGPELLAVILLGLLSVAASGGWSAVPAASLRVLGVERSQDLLAARALTHWAWASTAAGFLIGLYGVLALPLMHAAASGRVEDYPAPVTVAAAISTTLFAPLCGLLVGRLILGSFADAARHSAGIRRRAFHLGSDLGLFTLLVPPILVFTLVFLPWNA